ncbi:MAG: PQQ-binding-like beta-propeller repeat protein, partial [Planctomycetota bacterium]
PARAQFDNPVYADDSPTARDTLASLAGVVEAENLPEAVRVLQRLLETEGDRVLETPGDPDLFVSVRARVHRALLDNAALLERYREIEGPAARSSLDAGDIERVERARLLTRAGYEAALRLARSQIHRGVFDAARLTLEPLVDHPDHAGANARAAAELARETARYLDRPGVWAWAEAWERASGVAPTPRDPIGWPDRLRQRATDPSLPADAVDTDGLVQTPLQSARIVITSPELEELARRRQIAARGNRGRLPDVTPPWIYPLVLGELVVTNDGRTVRGWDRYTLAPRWRLDFPSNEETGDGNHDRRMGRIAAGRLGSVYEDVAAITWSYPYLLTTTGRAINNGREGDPRLHAIEPQTGRVAWSVAVAGDLDERLDFASIRGAPVCDGATVVVAARKYIPARRTSSVYLVGLDLATGAKRWVRLLGSVGALPHRSGGLVGATSVLHHGVIYRTDELGVTAAVEIDTGRTRWIRRGKGPARRNSSNFAPWIGSKPIIDRDSLVALDTDRSRLFRLALEDGRLLGERPSASFGDVRYLVGVGDRLAAIGKSTIATAPIDAFETADVSPTPVTDPQGFAGRAVVAGDRLLMPTSAGAVLVDPAEPSGDVIIPLERSGHVLPIESQLIVADDKDLHSYLVWDVAVRLLQDRIDANPGQPDPARTFAELAFRAGRAEQIVPAIDIAMEALDSDPLDDNVEGRRAVFEAIRTMVIAAQHGSSGASDGASALARQPEIVGDLIDRLGLLAGSAEDRVVHLMARGEHDEQLERPDAAARAYQAVLDDPALADSVWVGRELLVRGDFEARRRLGRLLAAHGPRVYAIYDAEARAAAEPLVRAGDTEGLEALARRYPVGLAAPELWLHVAQSVTIEDPIALAQRRVDAFRAGLDATNRIADVGGEVAPEVEGELTGSLVMTLAELGEAVRAMEALAEQRQRRPGLALTANGSPLPDSMIQDAMVSAQSATLQRPVLGVTPDTA